MIDLSIVIVSYNVRDLLADCLRSIASSISVNPAGMGAPSGDGLAIEVIVVDSASTDSTPSMIRKLFPWARLIALNENVGFSRGNNIGIEAAGGRRLLLINPDTIVEGNALANLCSCLDTHPEVGLVGPQLLNADGTVQSSRRRFPTLLTAFFESTWLQPFAPPSILRSYYGMDKRDDEIASVDWVTGAAMLVRKEVIEQVGGLDERFFMYSEELDWQRRIKRAGWDVVYYPEAKVTHFGGKSSEQAEAATHIAFQRSKFLYFRKYHGVVPAFVLRMFLLASYTFQLVIEASKAVVGHKRPLRMARIRVYWQAIQSGFRGI